MSQHVVAGAMGGVIGHTLGAPRVGGKEFRRLSFFEPVPARMASAPALDAWLVWSNHLRNGRPPETLSQSWLSHWNYPQEESAFGLANCARGFGSPLSGSFANPLPSGSQAIGRAAFWGLAFHGQPEKAAEYAYYDASLDHAGSGVAVAVTVAKMIAITTPETSFPDYVRVITRILPSSSPLLKVLPDIISRIETEDGPRQIRLITQDKLGVADELDANRTLAWILAGLGQLRQGFGPAILATAGCGGASDHATLAVGVIAALKAGVVDQEWAAPLGTDYVAGHGLRNLDAPATLSAFASIIEEDFQRPVTAAPTKPREVSIEMGDDISSGIGELIESDAEAETSSEAEAPVPAVPDRSIALLASEGNVSSTEISDILISIVAIDPLVVIPGKSVRFQLDFRNLGDADRTISAQLIGGEGWKIATHLSGFRLKPGETASFPVVAQSPEAHSGAADQLRLRFDKFELLLPLAGSQKWYAAGPFVNHDGNGFEKAYGAELKQSKKDVFNGRSDLAIKWKADQYPGNVFEIEPLFRLGPGVVYLYAIAKFARPGTYRVVAATEVGLKMWVDGTRIVSYHDVHQPVPRVQPPYVGEFSTVGEARILIKLLRGLPPIGPLVLYFLNEDGKLVQPDEFLTLE